MRFAVQYLEDGPGVATIAPEAARARLRAACERLPISVLILGWNLPYALAHACREEASRVGVRCYRWHPLLTGEARFVMPEQWGTVGLEGDRLPGFRGLPEFTFVCPNRPAAREAVLDHLREAIRRDDYEGVFLDRIRFPSPAADPSRWLACFCEDCHRAAMAEGFDLDGARQHVRELVVRPEGALSLVDALLGLSDPAPSDPARSPLQGVLEFRTRSVTRFVQEAADLICGQGLAIGLDCFSPALTRMVGQDLGALDRCGDWIKVMTYGHALGPASLPFELLDLANWLVTRWSIDEVRALRALSRMTRLPLPMTRSSLREQGLAPEALAAETLRARQEGVSTLWAGMELVEIERVARLDPAQIAADMRAFRTAGADGLVLSWDLWHMPLDRLDLVRTICVAGECG